MLLLHNDIILQQSASDYEVKEEDQKPAKESNSQCLLCITASTASSLLSRCTSFYQEQDSVN